MSEPIFTIREQANAVVAIRFAAEMIGMWNGDAGGRVYRAFDAALATLERIADHLDRGPATVGLASQAEAIGLAIEAMDEHLSAEQCADRLPALRASYETLRRLAASETNVVDVQRPLSALP